MVYRAKNSAGYDCVVSEWYRKLAKNEQFDIIKQYDTLESYMQDIMDFGMTDEEISKSKGEVETEEFKYVIGNERNETQ